MITNMSKLNCSFFNSNDLTNTYILTKNDSAFQETSCSSIFSLDSTKVSEIVSESFSNKCDTKNVDIDKYTSNWKADSGILDSVNDIFESGKVTECDSTVKWLSENSGIMSPDFLKKVNYIENENNEFHDGFYFFNDQPLINFYEDSKSSCNVAEPLWFRSSLYQEFDPLCAKYLPDYNKKPTELREKVKELKSLRFRSSLYRKFNPLYGRYLPDYTSIPTDLRENVIKTDFEHDDLGILLSFDNIGERESDTVQDKVKMVELESNEFQNNGGKAAPVNNLAPDSISRHSSGTGLAQSLGNNLSFDLSVTRNIYTDFEKLYSEEELNQSLKMQEHSLEENYLRKQQVLKEIFSKRQQELHEEHKQKKILTNAFRLVIKEILDITLSLSDKNTLMKTKLDLIEKENKELKFELSKSVEDLQNRENTFSTLHNRYEQCKRLLKVCIENEKNLLQQIEDIKMQLCEKEKTNFGPGIQEQLDRCNTELAMVRKTVDDQIEELKLQLQQAELNISISERNLSSVKTENEKLNCTFNDLISKVHRK